MKLGSRAAANAVRGLGGSLPLALLPSLLSRRLDADAFTVWLLVIQIATYVTYVEFGVQSALIRTTARAYGSGNADEARLAVRSGLRLLCIATGFALLALTIAALGLNVLFDIPQSLASEARLATLLIGVPSALALTGSAVHGVLIGAGHHWISAIVIVVARLSGVVVAVLAASNGAPITVLAVIIGASTLLGSFLAHVAALAIGLPVPYRGASVAEVRSIAGVVLTLGIGGFAMLVITGVDIFVVGFVDYSRLAAYGLASSLVLIAASGFTIVGSALLPVFSEFLGRDEAANAERLLWRTTLLSAALLGVAFACIAAARTTISDRWADEYSDEMMPILLLLAAAQGIRLTMTPTAGYIFASNDHRSARFPAVAEAAVNLVASCILGAFFGYIGVACGTVIGILAAYPFYVRLMGYETSQSGRASLLVRTIAFPFGVTSAASLLLVFDVPFALPFGVAAVVALVVYTATTDRRLRGQFTALDEAAERATTTR